MKSILILSFTRLQHDARITRQIDFLKQDYLVTVVALDGNLSPEANLIRIEKPRLTLGRKIVLSIFLLLRMHVVAYGLLYGNSNIRTRVGARKFDLIIANDVECLPLAFRVDPAGNVLFDAHEYAPRHFEDKLVWRVFFQPFNVHFCKKYIPRVKAMITVGEGLANEYAKNFPVSPVIITNAPSLSKIPPAPVRAGRIRMVHHGGATPSRHLELMIEMMKFLDGRFTLDLILITPEMASAGTRNYISRLRDLARGDERIQFLPPLKIEEIVPFLNNYDLGVILVPPINFNYENGLPNKLFDFIQAKIGVATGPTREIARTVEAHGIGIVSKDFSAAGLADKLSTLSSSQIEQFKANAVKASQQLNSEANRIKLLELVGKIISD